MTTHKKLDKSPRILSKNPNRVKKEVLDLSDNEYGQLIVKNFAGTDKNGNAFWECLCSCGNKTVVSSQALRSGATISCGHVSINKSSERMRKISLKHGASKEDWYSNYSSMVKRAANKKSDAYKSYHSRHPEIIKWIEQEWLDNPWSFFDEIGKKPSSEYSIDRIDNNKGYVKNNVRWATKSTQAYNRDGHLGSSGYRGIRLLKAGYDRRATDVYNVRICVNKKIISLGNYDSLEDAKVVRYRAEEKYGQPHTFTINSSIEPKKHVQKEPKNLLIFKVGDKFNHLTITNIDSKNIVCVCDCGKEVKYTIKAFRHRRPKSCGVIRRHKITQSSSTHIGETYGELTLIKYHHSDKYYNCYWLARCSCGKELLVTYSSLKTGRKSSCGHLQSKMGIRKK